MNTLFYYNQFFWKGPVNEFEVCLGRTILNYPSCPPQRIAFSSTSQYSSLTPIPLPSLNKYQLAWLQSRLNLDWLQESSSLWSTTTGPFMGLSMPALLKSCFSAMVHQMRAFLGTGLRTLRVRTEGKAAVFVSHSHCLNNS